MLKSNLDFFHIYWNSKSNLDLTKRIQIADEESKNIIADRELIYRKGDYTRATFMIIFFTAKVREDKCLRLPLFFVDFRLQLDSWK